MRSKSDWPTPVGALIDTCEEALADAGVFCGHGTDNWRDEAAALVYGALQLSHAEGSGPYSRPVAEGEWHAVAKLLRRRIDERVPLAYLLGEAWFAGLPFFVDQRVLIPRSPFAELILDRFRPWVIPERVGRILEIGTGSGCIAIACAMAFPDAEVVATDLSGAALEVARKNVRRHGLEARVRLQQADLFGGVQGRFDLIVSNPPYVPDGVRDNLPLEYAHEPALGLYSGADGLESPRRILQDAPRHLTDQGWLALEVGAGQAALERAFPDLPLIWPALERGGEGIALIDRAGLDCSASDLSENNLI